MVGMIKTDAPTYLGDAPAIMMVAVWLGGVLAAALFVLNRRDG